MAFYKFTNGTLADANQVNANSEAILNGLLSISYNSFGSQINGSKIIVAGRGTINAGSSLSRQVPTNSGSWYPYGSPMDSLTTAAFDLAEYTFSGYSNTGAATGSTWTGGGTITCSQSATTGLCWSKITANHNFSRFPLNSIVAFRLAMVENSSNSWGTTGGLSNGYVTYGSITLFSLDMSSSTGTPSWDSTFVMRAAALTAAGTVGSWEVFRDGTSLGLINVSGSFNNNFEAKVSINDDGNLTCTATWYPIYCNPSIAGVTGSGNVYTNSIVVKDNLVNTNVGSYMYIEPEFDVYSGSISRSLYYSTDNGNSWAGVSADNTLATISPGAGSWAVKMDITCGSHPSAYKFKNFKYTIM
jgi:hypothetical protein